MARPFNADSAATKQRILDRAAALFADRGPTAVSVRDIAQASSVSLAMVNHYFGSKEELHRATVDAMYAELAEVKQALEKALLETGDKKALVRRAAEEGFDFARAHQLASRTVMRTVIETGEIPKERREKALIPFLAGIEMFLGGGETPRHELRLRAQSIVFLVVRYALSTIEELAVVAGLPEPQNDPKKTARVLRAVKDHLAELAVRALVSEEEISCPTPEPKPSKHKRLNPSRYGARTASRRKK